MSAETNFETAVRAALETYDESLPLAPQHNRSQTLKVEREKASESTHVGSIGYRIRVSGVLMRTWNAQSDWGVTTKCAVVSDTGSIMIVNNLTCDIGDRVEFTGTVSRHDDYRGTSQTVFTRPAKVTVTKPTP